MVVFTDSQEYLERKARPFRPPTMTVKRLKDSVPDYLFQRSTTKGLAFVARDIVIALTFYFLTTLIDPICSQLSDELHVMKLVVKWSLWCLYWFWQGLAFAGIWVLGHEAGHGSISPISWINHIVGFVFHTFLLAPYFAWKASHNLHHKATNSMDHDENFVPRTRSDCGIPTQQEHQEVTESAEELENHDSAIYEALEETPIYTLARAIFMQLCGWNAYLALNTLGNPKYPVGTNHFEPTSPLFKPSQRTGVMISNIGLGAMALFLLEWVRQTSLSHVLRVYGVPYLLCNHWIVMVVFLQHTDPTITHYRAGEWTFLRGALSTCDRDFLGWIGRFFLHNVSHDHLAHHVFSTVPFYNLPEVTHRIKRVLGEDYTYDSTNCFWAYWRSFTQCVFVEDDGDILFYKNREGKANREVEQ